MKYRIKIIVEDTYDSVDGCNSIEDAKEWAQDAARDIARGEMVDASVISVEEVAE